MSTDPKRTLFACTWCGTDQVLLDLDPRTVADATEAWHAEHDPHDPHHDKPRCCDDCGAVSPVQAIDHRTVIGLTTFDQQSFMDWLDDHDCASNRSPELNRWDECVRRTPSALELLEQIVGPRPSWAPAANDMFGDVASYGSEPARVHIRRHSGCTVGTEYTPAHIDVQACMYRPVDGGPAVGMTTVKRAQETWVRRSTRMTTDEARQLAATLITAAALAESEPIGGPS